MSMWLYDFNSHRPVREATERERTCYANVCGVGRAGKRLGSHIWVDDGSEDGQAVTVGPEPSAQDLAEVDR